MALEELCVFGEYGALHARLASLPPTLPELFEQVLARLEHDHTRSVVAAVCSFLAAARAGLLETEVLELVAVNNKLSRLQWMRLYRALEPYLKPVEEQAVDRVSSRLDFYHDQLRLAVYKRYFAMSTLEQVPTEAFRTAHRALAEYFRRIAYEETWSTKWRSRQVRSLSELPFHQASDGAVAALDETLCDLHFVSAKAAAGLTYQLLADYDFALTATSRAAEANATRQGTDSQLTNYTSALLA